MKVLLTLDSLNRGGAETRVLDICRKAKIFGLDVTFVATGDGTLEADFKNSDVEFIRLQRDLPLDLNLVWQLRQIIKERRIEIVQGFQPVEALHLYLATLGIKSVKCVLTHEGFIEGRKNRLTAKFLAPLMDANIAVSRALFPWLRKEIGLDTSKNFYLIYNGIDKDRLQPGGHLIKQELGFDKETLLFGMVANFRADNTKDQMTVCRSLPVVFEEFDNANFIFVGRVNEGGENNFEECLRFCDEHGIGEKVFFLGGRDDVPDILDSLDLFVFSSLKEGLPLAVVEAMFAKVPVIVSDIPPLLELADQGKNAETFQVKNVQELSTKIIKVMKNDDLKHHLTKNAFNFAQRNFSLEAHFYSLKTLYLDLLNDNDNKEDSDINEASGKADSSEKKDSIFDLD